MPRPVPPLDSPARRSGARPWRKRRCSIPPRECRSESTSDSVKPTVATAFAPKRATKKTSTTANTLSMIISRTMGIASIMIAVPIGPSV